MRLGRAILVVGAASVLLAACVGVASAGRLSTSANTVNAVWTRLIFSGGIGNVECEVIVNGTFHERTISKIRGSLTGLITAANISRCARGGGSVLRETLPWHVRYDSFQGTLPNISLIRALVVGLAFRIREPTFGIECLSRATAEEPGAITFNLDGSRQVATANASGTIRCTSFNGTLSGTSSTIGEAAGARVTVTLI